MWRRGQTEGIEVELGTQGGKEAERGSDKGGGGGGGGYECKMSEDEKQLSGIK